MADERINIDDKAFWHWKSGAQHGAKVCCLAADAFDVGKGNVREGVYPVQVGLTQLGKAGKSSQFNGQMHSAWPFSILQRFQLWVDGLRAGSSVLFMRFLTLSRLLLKPALS